MRVFIYYPRNKTYDRSPIRHSLFKAPPPFGDKKISYCYCFKTASAIYKKKLRSQLVRAVLGNLISTIKLARINKNSVIHWTMEINHCIYAKTDTHARHCFRRDARVSHYTSARAAIHSRCSGLGTITSRGKNLLAPAINPRCRNTADTTRCCYSSAVEFVKRRGVTRQVAKKRRYCCCFTCTCVCMYMYAR